MFLALSDMFVTAGDADEYVINMLKYTHRHNVNHAHPVSSMTPLMIAAARFQSQMVEELLNRGADVRIVTGSGWTVLDYAVKNHAHNALAVLERQLPCEPLQKPSDVEFVEQRSTLPSELKRRLCSYFSTHTEPRIDHKAVAMLISHEITCGKQRIVAFVPGVDDVLDILDLLEASDVKVTLEKHFSLLMLHDRLDTAECATYYNLTKAGNRRTLLFATGQ